jgi:hypothetical protein
LVERHGVLGLAVEIEPRVDRESQRVAVLLARDVEDAGDRDRVHEDARLEGLEEEGAASREELAPPPEWSSERAALLGGVLGVEKLGEAHDCSPSRETPTAMSDRDSDA